MTLPVFLADLDAVLAGTDPAPLPGPGETVTVTGPEARHAVGVRRLVGGDELVLADGRGGAVRCTVRETAGRDTMILTVDETLAPTVRNPRVTVVQAIPKSERAELAVDLACQGGADTVVPWQAERCIARWTGAKRDKALAKWRSAAVAAAKQSRRSDVPLIPALADSADIERLIGDTVAAGGEAVLLHEESSVPFGSVNWADAGEVVLVIGPEGGISPAEVDRFTAAGARSVRLGPEVLRTATAALSALSAIGVSSSRW
ncbi:16S rRNA (uracil(1498)-N(3))-methyltransferase [Corynebacterium pygosceleis]|uniref:Ribosomal RNA small subunit methyltransferase E n=1 Tax=Corynebacterium pygosceleis TaxID=2800406 RepID=A0ABT3WTE3_9CORY|nr:16S rRNA (uracil(1498)-N(3))-methyltransferase [Corynebacterium pygosceleis]MCK7675109.1 16S rRNA (uracil(1498)-N(3))-methyltransferase [Corynebacterium pygosceleis]MCL0120689.1 16S rRNA (uracil(1498)-N(3))-methyltransferase [Corynebacterium pygosceleis]MCX7444229.1 16S rRNA (uracil(1498)-N(3))-methyltransferase [Corynebacterium pygosceleis]